MRLTRVWGGEGEEEFRLRRRGERRRMLAIAGLHTAGVCVRAGSHTRPPPVHPVMATAQLVAMRSLPGACKHRCSCAAAR